MAPLTTAVGCAAKPNTNYCDTQLTVQNNSNRNLKPEKSKTATVGGFKLDGVTVDMDEGARTLAGRIVDPRPMLGDAR